MRYFHTAHFRQTFGDEELKCEAKCGNFTPPSCDPRCNTVICISGILGKNDEFCGTSLKRVDAEAIRTLDCEYDEVRLTQLQRKNHLALFIAG